VEDNTRIYVARTSNDKVSTASDFYCCLLPQYEALHTGLSSFLIATKWCCGQDAVCTKSGIFYSNSTPASADYVGLLVWYLTS